MPSESVSAGVRSPAEALHMTTTRNSVPETTLYVCRDCGDGIEDPNTNKCPHCGGLLMNSTVPHD
ncbi:hypothetical protein DU504_15400 [Haloplanus salinus]|uniref:Rubrerythrin-like domain-containing protein n=1 Tax=Haloplanus salinus TaxID=1126245 RepID=A0A368N4I2_9EURY|nr:hypothetical protein DU504_15400 [Haloplanus salinus]